MTDTMPGLVGFRGEVLVMEECIWLNEIIGVFYDLRLIGDLGEKELFFDDCEQILLDLSFLGLILLLFVFFGFLTLTLFELELSTLLSVLIEHESLTDFSEFFDSDSPNEISESFGVFFALLFSNLFIKLGISMESLLLIL